MVPSPAPQVQVRLRAAPRYDPPYDDEHSGELWMVNPVQPLLSLARPPCPPATPPTARSRPGAATVPAPLPPVAAKSPPATAAVRFVNTCLEIFNGYRPVSHFRALASPLAAATVHTEMTHALRRLRRAASRGGTMIKLRQMRTCLPQPTVTEIAAVIGTAPARHQSGTGPQAPQRAWAFASRLEYLHGRWLCTAARVL